MPADRARDLHTRLLAAGLAVALAAAIVGAGYVAVAPIHLEPGYTELYLLGANGTASYPATLAVGETGAVTVGVENHEHREATYLLVVRSGDRVLETRTVTLADGGVWRETVTVTPEEAGRTSVVFALYRGGDPTTAGGQPYRWVAWNVTVEGG